MPEGVPELLRDEGALARELIQRIGDARGAFRKVGLAIGLLALRQARRQIAFAGALEGEQILRRAAHRGEIDLLLLLL